MQIKQERIPHKLKPNAGTAWPSNFIFFDTETYRRQISENAFKHELRLCVANIYSTDKHRKRDDWLIFYDKENFWNIIKETVTPKTRWVVIAHNIDFDLQVLDYLHEFDRIGLEITKFLVDANRFIIKGRLNGGSVLFLDSNNYSGNGKVSLKSIGSSIGLEKLDVNPLTADDKELLDYCIRDVEIVREYILKLYSFFRDNDLCHFSMTVASLAFNTYRHRFMKYPIFIHTLEKAIEMEREAYRGGRCECFYIGVVPENTIYNLDVNSMYPFVMLSYDYPNRHVFTGGNCSLQALKCLMDQYLVIADAEFEISEPAIAVKGERLIFPVGHIRQCVTSPELDYIIKNGKLIKIHAVSCYEHVPLFRDYITYFYNKRLEAKSQGNRVEELFYKMLLNSLYGKFGQKVHKLEPLNADLPLTKNFGYYYNKELGRKAYVIKIGNKWYISEPDYEGYNSMVAIAAFVTSYARMYLWSMIKKAGIENVYYCDTDSLFVNQKGFDNLHDMISDTKELGKLEVKQKASYFRIVAPKIYELDNIIRFKGIKTPESIKKEIPDSRFYRIKSSLRKAITGGVLEEHYIKRFNFEYKKGKVKEDGRVLPINLI